MSLINVPYLPSSVIHQKAEELRGKHRDVGQRIPVNAELLAELEGLSLIVTPGLVADADTEAVVLLATDELLVDETAYYSENLWPRLRFSIAHELGHCWLHRQLFQTVRFNSVNEWLSFIEGMDGYERLEFQANEFAGRLLVPRYELERLIREVKPTALEFALDKGDIAPRLAIMLSRKFQVSEDVITIRFERDELKDLIQES